MAENATEMDEQLEVENPVSLKDDLMVLTKVRLNVFVLITTLFGFILASRSYESQWVANLLCLIS